MLPKINRQVYYIYAPFYRYTSAGIKALYLLSHHLNLRGHKSYIVTDEQTFPHKELDELYHGLNISFLDCEDLKFHQKNGYNPIVIYSDTVADNPLKAKNIVRYMMNYSDLFVSCKKSEDEFVITYSKKIAESLGLSDDRVLFLPASNTNIFYPPISETKREGTCVYMGKYYDFHKGEQCSLTKNSKVFTRISGTITPQEMADLFRKSELLYLYENSAVATEAVLCGCPVVFIPNKFLKEDEINLSQNELGLDGYGISTKPETIELAKRNVHLGRENYLNSFKIFEKQLESFIDLTQKRFNCENTGSEWVVDSDYFADKRNILSRIVAANSNQNDTTIVDHKDFESVIKELKEVYPKKEFVKKIKLKNSNERVIIESKVSIKVKRANLGRLLKKLTINEVK